MVNAVVSGPSDLTGQICTIAQASSNNYTAQDNDKLSASILVTLLEAARTYAEPDCRDLARAFVNSPGTSSSLGGTTGASDQVASANAFLAHGLLRDDSYATALHPGQLIVPVALALSEDIGVSGEETLRAIALGYEIGCRYADLVLPESASRGWRATALVSPVASAATAASMVKPADFDVLSSAVRLAMTVVGGTLHTIAIGADWRMQPALLVSSGIACARLAASGYCAAPGHLEGQHGVVQLVTGVGSAKALRPEPCIRDVTYKSHAGPMFAQSLLRAVDAMADDILGEPCSLLVRMAPFAVAYAGSAKSATSVVSLEKIIRDRLAVHADASQVTGVGIEVVADPAVGDLDVIVECRGGIRAGAPRVFSGDTSSWTLDDVCRSVGSPQIFELAKAIGTLDSVDGVSAVIDAWQALADQTVWRLVGAAGHPLSE